MRIMGYDYKLIGDPFLDSMGSCQLASLTIKVDSRMAQQQLESTVLHEVIEALSRQMRLNLTEEQIMGLEAGLYQVLRDLDFDTSMLLRDLVFDRGTQG